MFVGRSGNVPWGSWHSALENQSLISLPTLLILCLSSLSPSQFSILLTLVAVGSKLAVFNLPSMSQILYLPQLVKERTLAWNQEAQADLVIFLSINIFKHFL